RRRAQRLRLERLRGHAQPVQHRIDRMLRRRGPVLTPHDDFHTTVTQRLEHPAIRPRVAPADRARDAEGIGSAPLTSRREHRLQVEHLRAEDAHRTGVGEVGDENGYLPACDRSVEQPSTRVLDDVDDAGPDDVEPIAGGAVAGAKSRASALVYSSNTFASGIE